MYLNKCNNTSKFTLPVFDENFANLYSAKFKYTFVYNKEINYPIQAL